MIAVLSRNAVHRWVSGIVVLTVLLWGSLPAVAQASDCSRVEVPGLVPLNDLGDGTYEGLEGGLYPGGVNEVPPAHLELGLRLADEIQPLAPDGSPSGPGKIGLLSIGVSNTMIEFAPFMRLVEGSDEVNPAVVTVNAAVSGQPIDTWLDPDGLPWATHVPQMLADAGVTPEQVQVVWVMTPDRQNDPAPFPDFAETSSEKTAQLLVDLVERFPNLRLAYLSSSEYRGYATDYWGEEPVAYEHGFAVKWVIERQIEGDVDLNADPAVGPRMAPWLSWGPYTWANGETPRSDGLTWECGEYRNDGVHPVGRGAQKVGAMLFDHLSTDPTSVGWFLAQDGAQPIPTSQVTIPQDRSPQARPMSTRERMVWGIVFGTVAGSIAGIATLMFLSFRDEKPQKGDEPGA